MKIFIEPNDVLMFRDGRPFAGGDDHFARGVFPPSPATIYGALRSQILSHRWPEFDKYKSKQDIPEDLKKEIGTRDELGSLSLFQFTLARMNGNDLEQLFPIPKDVVKEKGNTDAKPCILGPINLSDSKIITDLPAGLKNIWHLSEKPMEGFSGFLAAKEMEKYLLGITPVAIKNEAVYETEERTGIGKSRTSRSVETGRLFSVEYFRLKESCGFAVEVGNTNLLPGKGMLRLGGDNRSARYETVSWNDIPVEPIKKKISKNKRFKLMLTTPAIFKKGWMPDGINDDTMQGQINGISVKLISACIGKPIGIGGYDFAKNQPKVMKKAVPSGSVYYLELREDNVDSLFDKFWLKSISDEKTQEGFGITLIGGLDYV